ncbi:calcium-binding protein [Falsiruegeria mediterranea]|uniref:calcium-binding protein n=1 Tax=Falsiruegeria mediterranea TaxID=1280832 RepID=UPI0015F25D73|nr:calcium-binding protein [Falsiruegeria mediterranea]
MTIKTFAFNANPTETAPVTNSHFGTNLLIHADRVSDTSDTVYEDLVNVVQNNIIRYPGGTVTEQFFDPANPDATLGTDYLDSSNEKELTPLSDVIAYAEETGAELVIVVPTWRYFDATQGDKISGASKLEIRTFVTAVMENAKVADGTVKIAGFEIGNEWYQDNFNWSDIDFGKLAGKIAQEIESGIDAAQTSAAQDPMIFMQASQYDERNKVVRSQFDDDAYAAVDGVVTHFYAVNGNGNPMGAGGGLQSRLKDIEEAWGDPDTSEDLLVLISEWNVGGDGPGNTALSGLKRNAPLMRTFAEMIENGVDLATFWTAVAPGPGAESLARKSTVLADMYNGAHLTPTGYLYRMLSENVIGTNLQTDISDFKLNNENNAYVMAFEGDGRTVLYFTSGTDSNLNIDADLTGLLDSNSHIHVTRLGMVGTDNTAYYGEGELTQLSAAELTRTGDTLRIDLGAYELAQVVITDQSTGAGVHLYGDDQNDQSDRLYGTINADTIEGNAGNDTLIGEAGNDYLSGGDNNDSVSGGSGNDTIFTGTENNDAHYGSDTADGGNGNDSIVGSNGTDLLYGGLGNDTLNGGQDWSTADADTLYGGTGDDLLSSGQDIKPHTDYQAVVDRLYGEAGNDTLVGGVWGDYLSGGHNNDEVSGGAGNDTIFTGTENNSGHYGSDTAHGGNGSDSIMGSNGTDLLNGGDGNDTLNGGQDWSTADADTLYGGSGDDLLTSGQDITVHQNYQDVVDRLYGEAGNDTLVGGRGDDYLSGGHNNDDISGGDGDDTIFTGTENNGDHYGSDTVYGGIGNDSILGSNGTDLLYGDAGNDTLNGGQDWSTADADTLYGGSGDDLLTSGQDITPHQNYQDVVDHLYGEAGNDTLVGGLGDDRLVGGSGSDVFVFENNFGEDTIDDFDVSQVGEQINLANVSGITDFSDLSNNHLSQLGSDAVITVGADNTITLTNVVVGSLSVDDFVF